MLINIVLLFLVFGATKKKFSPYAAAAILGAVKGVLYFIGSQSVISAVVGFIIFGGRRRQTPQGRHQSHHAPPVAAARRGS